MRTVFCSLLLIASSLWLGVAHATSVVFLSPGSASETYWASYSGFMQAAAKELGMSLQVRYSNRDSQAMVAQAREALFGVDRPEYLMFVNETFAGPEILRLSRHSTVKLFAVSNSLTPDQIKMLGNLHDNFPHWIGSLTGNDEEGGYLMASELIRLNGPVAPGQTIDMLAFSGASFTPAAQRREAGLERALAEHPEVRLRQMVHGGWERERAAEQARLLFNRYPETRLVWSANDEMAFGAMAALRETGRIPGKDVLFSALNSSNEALHALLDGSLSVLTGGQFTLGGWAMVVLHDYDATRPELRKDIGPRQARMLQMIDSREAQRLLSAGQEPGYGVKFRDYSLTGKPASSDYHFSLKSLQPGR